MTKKEQGHLFCAILCVLYGLNALLADFMGDQAAFDRTMVQSSVFLAATFIIGSMS